MTALGMAGALVAALLHPLLAGAPVRVRDWPCTGCLVSGPMVSPERLPLMVLLHGDFETPDALLAKWEHVFAGRAIVVALACPASEGCHGSWWRWNGDPAWIEVQVRRVAEARPVDADRRWLAAWSGGASYVGWNTQRFESMFSAIVLHGGGMGPAEAACAARPSDVYFLVGDRNPLHRLAVSLRQHYDSCGARVTWDVLPGADHAGEWAALEGRSASIWSWLTGPRVPPASSAGPPGVHDR